MLRPETDQVVDYGPNYTSQVSGLSYCSLKDPKTKPSQLNRSLIDLLLYIIS